MTTTAPVRKVHDIPIVEPQRVPVAPRELPSPNPDYIFPIVVPIRQPVRQPERVRL